MWTRTEADQEWNPEVPLHRLLLIFFVPKYRLNYFLFPQTVPTFEKARSNYLTIIKQVIKKIQIKTYLYNVRTKLVTRPWLKTFFFGMT